MDPVTDRGLWGFVVIALTLIVLAVGLLYAHMTATEAAAEGSDDEPRIPPDAEAGYSYTCYCYRDPIRVTIAAPGTRRRHARAGRHRIH
ncbi:hypothetical protein [Streptomyces sp. NPDC051569]|uniref:hypothetical protein n=1 Tax=Streptomyces sp. NPDC051569 TaxID=3365661 RepID=UPI0037BDCC35